MTRTVAALLEDAIAALRRSRRITLESAVVLPAPARAALAEAERIAGPLPSWVRELYSQIGGGHISWRAAATGDEPGDLPGHRIDRYDVSGNLDLLSLDELCHGITGHGWAQALGERARGYWPVDFASAALNLGFVPACQGDAGDPVLLDLVEDRRVSLAMTLPSYLQAGARLWFADGWQLTLLDDDEATRQDRELREIIRSLGG
jgi:hypothetical protein